MDVFDFRAGCVTVRLTQPEVIFLANTLDDVPRTPENLLTLTGMGASLGASIAALNALERLESQLPSEEDTE